MSTNTGAVRTGGGYLGGIRVAPLGTTAPTTPTASYSGSWLDPGIIAEDGAITESRAISTDDKRGRDGSLIRRLKTDETISFAFSFGETNGIVIDQFYGAGSRAVASGITTITKKTFVPTPQAFAIDELDSGVHTRTIIPKASLFPNGDITYNDQDIKIYPVMLVCYVDSSGTWAITYTDDVNVSTP